MTDTENSNEELLSLVRSMRDELSMLTQRVGSLESAIQQYELTRPVIDEKRLAIVSGAIAAYLGVKPKIRQIRLVSSRSWAHQGRATIHASHSLAR